MPNAESNRNWFPFSLRLLIFVVVAANLCGCDHYRFRAAGGDYDSFTGTLIEGSPRVAIFNYRFSLGTRRTATHHELRRGRPATTAPRRAKMANHAAITHEHTAQ